MRILFCALLGVAQSDAGQQFNHAGITRFARHTTMDFQHFCDLIANGFHRIERAGRILRNKADARPAQAVKAARGPAADVGAVKQNAAVLDVSIFGQQADDRLCGGGLARAGLADQCDDFTR